MKKIFQSILLFLLLLTIYYLLLPSPIFPPPPPGSLRSTEPGDLESIYRRAFFTNYSRSEILKYYSRYFNPSFPLQYLLTYPPAEAFSIIRDQTKSSWLQEIVHPWRESLYINGFYPTLPTEQININGVHYINKITIRYIPSHPVTRLTVMMLTSLALYWLFKEYAQI
jgi:hypothetical protein